MLKSKILCCFFTVGAVGIFAQTDLQPQWLEVPVNEEFTVQGNLSEGAPMEDLSWAWNSSVACFPATQARKFTGNHVLYALDLPDHSEMEIKVVPADKSANFSLYAYEVGQVAANNTVPRLSSCIRCEADHKWDYKVRGKTQDHTRSVHDILAINNPYQVVIGVVGAEGLKEGAYTLVLKIRR